MLNKIVHIALPIPVNRYFSYLIPDEFDDRNLIGKRALVPLGKRTVTGVIVAVDSVEKNDDLKVIVELLDDIPSFSAKMLEFTKWISEYYICSHGEVLKAALPQGMSPKSVFRVSFLKELSDEELRLLSQNAPKRAQLLSVLSSHSGEISVQQLEKLLETDSISTQINYLESNGIISCELNIEGAAKAKRQKAIRIPDPILEDSIETGRILDILEKKSNKQSVLFSAVYLRQSNSSDQILLNELVSETSTSLAIAKGLEAKGYLEIYETEVLRNIIQKSEIDLGTRDESLLKLTDDQAIAVDVISKSIDSNGYSPFLLHGVTGSGKTLVYIHLIRKVIESGKTAIMLVPEIALTPQLIDRFSKTFDGDFAVLHSKMSEGDRFDAWRSIRSGKVKFVIGARSAIFAPIENVGMIIVDEEHESSYKQVSPAPRYQARDIAVYRAFLENAVVLLGSATPSLESMNNVKTGKYKLLEITGRADGATLPEVDTINTLEARKHGQMIGSVSKIMLDEIADRIQKKEGVILFQNRRGYASYLECSDCGFIPVCKNCDVTLTLHKSKNQLICHYCGFVTPALNSCASCGNDDMKEVGYGTQRIEDELSSYFEGIDLNARIERLDLDSTAKKGSHRKILSRFQNGEIDILIGTQMVAKGLDFARVSLVGVVNADLQMFLPDFRATERTFQLLTQVSGRAGRSSEFPGRVIIQTSHPESHAVNSARTANYTSFYEEEIRHRKNAGYPPFSRFCMIEFSGNDEDSVKEHCYKFLYLLPFNEKFWTVLGPIVPSISRIKNEFRRILIIKDFKESDKNGKRLRFSINRALEIYRKNYSKSSIRINIDIDSYSSI